MPVAVLSVPLTSIVPLELSSQFCFCRASLAAFAFSKLFSAASTVSEPALTTPLVPTIMPSLLKKYRLPPTLLSRMAFTVPLISILLSTVLTRVLKAALSFAC